MQPSPPKPIAIWSRSRLFFLLIIAVFALSFLMKLLSYHLDPIITRDGYTYIKLAESWYDTGVYPDTMFNGYSNWVPPFYLFLMKSLMSFGFSAEMAGIWINLVLGSFIPLLAYGIAYEIIQRQDIAICTALLTAVNPSMNELAVGIQRDIVYLFFSGVIIWSLSAGIHSLKWRYWFGAGLACGCAVLTRFEALEFLVIVSIIFFCLCGTKQRSWKRILCWAATFSLSFCGSLLFLSSLMRTQDFILSSYKQYFYEKITKMENQIQTGWESQ